MEYTMKKISRIVLPVVILGALASSSLASSQFTTVQAPASGEKSQAWILGKIYGGTFTKKANGVDYTNGSITAQRLIDKGVAAPSNLSVPASGLPGDNQWIGPAPVSITVKAKFAAHNATFGYFDDTTSVAKWVPLISTSQLDSPITAVLPVNFRWGLKNNTTGSVFTSRLEDNVEGTGSNRQAYDHMVSYKMLGLPNSQYRSEWALFWEDLKAADCSDWDFNDAAITVSTTVIPAPGAAGALAGVGLVALRRRRR
jgi:hypothetical protein